MNFIADLPPVLATRGVSAVVIAAGPARRYLARRGNTGFVEATGDDAETIIARYTPALVVLGTSENPQSLAFGLEASCMKRGIPTVGAVDSPAAAAQRFRGESSDPLAHAPDWLLVPDRWTALQYEQVGYPHERIVVCGHPHHDFVRGAGERLGRAKPPVRHSVYPYAPDGSRILVFAAELSTGLDPADYRRGQAYTLDGRGESAGRTEIVMEEFLDAASLLTPRPYCVLRLHPKNDVVQFAAYIPEFQQVSQDEPALEVIAGSDGVVGMTTMLLVEAVLLGKPTLSILPRELEREWLVTTHFGLTPCATDRAQVRAEVARLAAEGPVAEPSQVAEILGTGSLERAADAIGALIGKRR